MKKKLMQMLALTMLSVFAFTGCKAGNAAETDTGNNVGTQETEENGKDKADLYSPGQFGNTSADNGLANGMADDDMDENDGNDTGTNMDGAANDAANDIGNAVDDVGDAAKDVGDDAKDAVDDVADGVGDAIDNLGGGSFDKYEDAKDYLLGKLQEDNAAANYEVREENKDLTAYNNADSGAEGYQFSIYETDGNEKIGIYYVDKDTGKIYRYMGKNSIEGY